MPLPVRCPDCGSKLRDPDAAAGKSLNCPSCAAVVPVPAAASAITPRIDDAPTSTTRRDKTDIPPSAPAGESGHNERRRRDYEPDAADEPRRGAPVAVWIVGAAVAAGAGCFVLGLAAYFVMPSKQREGQQAKLPAMEFPSDTGAGESAPSKKPDAGAQEGGGTALGDRRVAPDEAWDAGPASVQVAGASVYDEDLMLIVVVKVADPKAKVTFRPWRDPLVGRAKVWLADNNGTVYQPKGFDPATELAAAGAAPQLAGKVGMGSGAVYSNQPRGDLLLFEKPTPAAEYLDLDLDAAHVGQSGTIRFRIPRGMWTPKARVASPLPMPTTKAAPAPPKAPRRSSDK